MRHLVTTVLVAVSLIAAGCSDDADTATDATTTTTTTTTTVPATTVPAPTSTVTTTAPTTTSTTTTSTTTTTTTSTTVPVACPGSGALPDQAENHTLAGGDVNGDGAIDTLHAYTLGDPSLAGAWWLQVSFANGGGTALQILDDGTALSGVMPFDGADIDGNGTDEFFARVGAGASVSILGLFTVVDCTLTRVDINAEPSTFAIGGSLNFVNGIECVDIDSTDYLIVYTGSRLGDTAEFEITGAQYSLQGATLELVLADGIGGNQNDPGFVTFSSAGCPGLGAL